MPADPSVEFELRRLAGTVTSFQQRIELTRDKKSEEAEVPRPPDLYVDEGSRASTTPERSISWRARFSSLALAGRPLLSSTKARTRGCGRITFGSVPFWRVVEVGWNLNVDSVDPSSGRIRNIAQMACGQVDYALECRPRSSRCVHMERIIGCAGCPSAEDHKERGFVAA